MDIVRLKYRGLETLAQNTFRWTMVTIGVIDLLCFLLNLAGVQDIAFIIYYYTNYFVIAATMTLATGVAIHLQYAMR